MVNTTDERMKRIAAAAAVDSIRSPYGRWLVENHDAFAEMLRKYRPRWEVLAAALAQEKLLSVPEEFWSADPAVGKEARKRAARLAKRTWERVHARMRDRGVPGPRRVFQEPAKGSGSEGVPAAQKGRRVFPVLEEPEEPSRPIFGPIRDKR